MAVLTVYFNTKYNLQNVPKNEDVLKANSSQQTFDFTPRNDVYERRRDFRIQHAPDDTIGSAKIVKAGDSKLFYDVVNVFWSNRDTVTISAVINPVLSYADAKVTGQVDRMTPTKKEENMLEEPFQPSNRLHNIAGTLGPYTEITGNTNINLCASTVDFDNAILQIEKAGNVTEYTYDSDGRIASTKTTGGAVSGGTGHYFHNKTNIGMAWYPAVSTSTGLFVYNLDNAKTNIALTKLNKAGMADAIVDKWSVPVAYINLDDGVGNEAPIIAKINGTENRKTLSATDLRLDTTVANPKAIYYPITITVSSLKSGESKTYRYKDIKSPSKDEVSFVIRSDAGPNGRPYCYPEYYRGSQGTPFIAVAGAQWDKPGVIFNGKSGELQNNYATAHALRNNETSYQQARFNSRVGVLTELGGAITSGLTGDLQGGGNEGDLGGAIGHVGKLFNTAINFSYNTQKNAEDATYLINTNLMNKTLYTPTYSGPSLQGNLLLPNTFEVREEMYTPSDVKAFDKFLQLYGYSEDFAVENYNIRDVSSRGSKFGYLQMGDCRVSITNPVVGAETEYENRLRAGIRIWNTAVGTGGDNVLQIN